MLAWGCSRHVSFGVLPYKQWKEKEKTAAACSPSGGNAEKRLQRVLLYPFACVPSDQWENVGLSLGFCSWFFFAIFMKFSLIFISIDWKISARFPDFGKYASATFITCENLLSFLIFVSYVVFPHFPPSISIFVLLLLTCTVIPWFFPLFVCIRLVYSRMNVSRVYCRDSCHDRGLCVRIGRRFVCRCDDTATGVTCGEVVTTTTTPVSLPSDDSSPWVAVLGELSYLCYEMVYFNFYHFLDVSYMFEIVLF